MDKQYLQSHISEQYNKELGDLLTLLNKMGKSVLKQFESVLTAIEEKDAELAKNTLKKEKKIIAYDQEIHELCYQIMALRNPVASDLRAVMSSLQITSDLDRIAEETNRIAKTIKTSAHIEKNVIKVLINYGAKVANHLGKTLTALNDLDVSLVANIIQKKKSMNTLYIETIQKLMTMDDKVEINKMTNYLFIAKGFETICGHSRNIAKYVVFYEEGVDVRHQPSREIIEQLSKSK